MVMCNRFQAVLFTQETSAKVQIPLQDHSILITDHIPVFGTQNSRICEEEFGNKVLLLDSRYVFLVLYTRVYLDININQQTHETPQLSYTQNDICVCTYTHTKIYIFKMYYIPVVLSISLSFNLYIRIPNFYDFVYIFVTFQRKHHAQTWTLQRYVKASTIRWQKSMFVSSSTSINSILFMSIFRRLRTDWYRFSIFSFGGLPTDILSIGMESILSCNLSSFSFTFCRLFNIFFAGFNFVVYSLSNNE